MIKLNNVTVNVEDKPILNDFSFEFEAGKIYAVMGPNGSGKSTLAYSISGHPGYEITKGTIEMHGEDITELEPHERAEKGIFLSFQSPMSLAGVKVHQLLQLAMNGKKDPLTLRKQTTQIAKELKIADELLGRPLNEGASGGEKKKMEVLQAMVLDKQFIIFDEVDTGVDVDALRTISEYLKKHKVDRTYILITHYNRILHYLEPDNVLVIKNGKLEKVGDAKLAEQIENKGYNSI